MSDKSKGEGLARKTLSRTFVSRTFERTIDSLLHHFMKSEDVLESISTQNPWNETNQP